MTSRQTWSSTLIPGVLLLLLVGMWAVGPSSFEAAGGVAASGNRKPAAQPSDSPPFQWLPAEDEAVRGALRSAEANRWPAGKRGPRRPPFAFDVDGIEQPSVVEAEDADVPDGALVVGVRTGAMARAYLVSAFEMRPLDGVTFQLKPDGSVDLKPEQAAVLARHVVNDVVGEQPVTVTYCELQECTRVLTAPKEDKALEVGVGGWNDGLVLVIDGQRVPQRSPDMPLEDMPFEVTTWKEWLEDHPETDVYIGG